MAKIDELYHELDKAPPLVREVIYQRVERDYGRGFAAVLRDTLESDRMLRETAASIARIGKA